MPSWWNGSGATTFGWRASWSSGWTASTPSMRWSAALAPRPGHRLGVLVDHLVPGSKESRLAAAVSGPHVLVTGTPFVDVWEAVHPAAIGIAAWPQVPRGVDWKSGVCRQLGLAAPPEMWRRILAGVRTYADLRPELVGAVERLIDFVSAPGSCE